ncbi:hypothetical protein BI347_08140 [Chromobacterium sphagni]|uniref:ABC transporter permease n=1 Tax=Chromobacterium sphagni TaxID=1903179 RepID=A0A1S1X252_9NEIS|nr:ABC transporter permease [Chromobacterium sphagni]OHX13485.1 hypothetical protein BI347_08140 [Chromobacterium sphagni]
MKSLLLRHVGRSMLRIRYRLLVIAMICATTFGVLVGAYSAIDGLFHTVDTIQGGSQMADIELLFATDDHKNLPDFTQIPGVRQVETRLLLTGQAKLQPQGNVSALLISAPPAQFSNINRLKLLQGRLPMENDPQGIVLERNCASFYGKSIGDAIPVKIGYGQYRFTVRGVAESPEYLVAPLNPSVYVPTNGSLCVMFGADAFMDRQLGFPAINSALLRFSSPHAAEKAKAGIIELAQTRLSLDFALSRQEQFSQKFLELDLNTFKVFLPTVVLVFAITSVIVVFFLMYQWIKEERPQIAMLLTLGYSRAQLAFAYLLPAWVIILLALIMGLAVAEFDMWAFGSNYARAIGMPEPTLVLQPVYLAAAFLLLAGSVGIGMLLPLRSIASIAPIDVLREQSTTQTSHRTEALVQAARLVPGPFWLKYAIRNLLRAWPVSLVSSLAISASLAVTVSFYISLTSMEHTALGSVQQDRWQAVVDLDAPWWDDQIAKLQAALPHSRWVPFVKGGAQLISPNGGGLRVDNAFLLGITPRDQVRHVNLIQGRMLTDSDAQGIIIERRLAADHHARVGQPITLKVRGRIFQATVVGIHSSAVPGEIITLRPFAQQMLSLDGQFTGAYLVSGLDGKNAAALAHVPGIVRITSKDEIVAAILNISSHIWVIIHLSALMSIVVSALFILTSITFTIISRRGEYGMLRIIGYRDSLITRIVLAEAAMIAIVAALLAIPLAYGLGNTLNEQLTQVWFKVNTYLSWMDYLRVLLPALLAMPFATMPALRSVFSLPPTEILKERKFG